MTSTELTNGTAVPGADLTSVNYTTLYVGQTDYGLLDSESH